MRESSATILFLYWVVVFMPFMAWTSYRRLKAGRTLGPKTERFQISVALLVVTALISLEAASVQSIGISFHPDFIGLLLAVSILIGLIAGIVRGRRRNPAPELRERVRLLYAPATPSEYGWSVVGGISAGIAEEIAYRAVLYELLARWIGYGPSLVLCVVLFVLAHLPQGLRGAIGVGALAILFHIVYVLSGSLLGPILIHAVYDVALFTILYREEHKKILLEPIEQPAGCD
ncbi:MAG TPA: CPBP family intramembrane glutamic endopeptidase [Terriglobales bacterium]|nr:CPBP family intramembrane glutamic endopeptidase [Terriglobales bacterium]